MDIKENKNTSTNNIMYKEKAIHLSSKYNFSFLLFIIYLYFKKVFITSSTHHVKQNKSKQDLQGML